MYTKKNQWEGCKFHVKYDLFPCLNNGLKFELQIMFKIFVELNFALRLITPSYRGENMTACLYTVIQHFIVKHKTVVIK